MDDPVLLSLVLLCARRKRRRKNRIIWVKKWPHRKRQGSAYENLIKELAVEDTENYRRFIRMDVAAFEDILQKVEPIISKLDTQMRRAIPAAEKLAITLRFLATGETYYSLSCKFGVGRTTIGHFIPQVCKAISEALSSDYMKVPDTVAEWRTIASRFEEQWNFPLCIGALGGKHVVIIPSGNSSSEVFNLKDHFSVVLLALVDADYQFIFVDANKNGRVCDSISWTDSLIQKALDDKSLGVPEEQTLLPEEKIVPHVFVADSTFTLQQDLMTPFPEREITDKQKIFNYRLCRAQSVAENAFGLLAWRWQVYNSPIRIEPNKAHNIIMATCVLHNYLRRQSGTCHLYSPMTAFDQEYTNTGEMAAGAWRTEQRTAMQPVLVSEHNSPIRAKHIRDTFMSYFCSQGEVEWQWRLTVVGD